jgi:putative flippase GtrA
VSTASERARVFAEKCHIPGSTSIIKHFLRYATVGVVSNLVLYTLYLVATGLGTAPKVAMTVLYAAGVLQTFLFNKRWSFRDRGPKGVALLRYCVAYASGYALNYTMLAVFVDVLQFRHEYVQGATVLLVAVYLFVLQWTWVFQGDRGPALKALCGPG